MMLEGKLVVGRYIDGIAGAQLPNGPSVAGFQPMNPQILHINESTRSFSAPKPFGAKTSTTGPGLLAKVHRNYQWLEYVPGFVSEVPQNGMDVLTGPMSGCWITRYVRLGITYVGHIGSADDAVHAQTIASKAAWNAFPGAGLAQGFNPFNAFMAANPIYPARQQGENLQPRVYALVTAAGTFHTIWTWPLVGAATTVRIAAVQQFPNALPTPVP
jgi:hypothetical protein